MIDDKALIKVLEFIEARSDKRKDYAELFEQLPDLGEYLRYLEEEGLIARNGSFSSGNPRKHVTSIKGEFHHFEQYANIQLTSKGINFLKEKRKSTLEQIKEEYRKQGVPWFVTLTLSAISYVLGTLTPWLIQKFW